MKKSVLSIDAEILGFLAFAAAMTLMRIPSKFPLTFTINKNWIRETHSVALVIAVSATSRPRVSSPSVPDMYGKSYPYKRYINFYYIKRWR